MAAPPYLLRDMAADTVGLMDHLGIDSAHIVGASMGGMIVQTMAIEHPERVRSLVSIMSNTGSRWTGMPSRKAMAVLLGRPPRGRDAAVERAVKTFGVIGSPGYPFDEERVRRIAGRSYDRGHSAAGVAPPAARDHRLRRPHPGPARRPRPDHGHPRQPRPARPPGRRPRHRHAPSPTPA